MSERVIRRLRYLGELLSRIDIDFGFDRDPDDQPFLELAIEGQATHRSDFANVLTLSR